MAVRFGPSWGCFWPTPDPEAAAAFFLAPGLPSQQKRASRNHFPEAFLSPLAGFRVAQGAQLLDRHGSADPTAISSNVLYDAVAIAQGVLQIWLGCSGCFK